MCNGSYLSWNCQATTLGTVRMKRGTGEDCMNVYKSMGVCGMGYKGKGAGTNVTKKGARARVWIEWGKTDDEGASKKVFGRRHSK